MEKFKPMQEILRMVLDYTTVKPFIYFICTAKYYQRLKQMTNSLCTNG